MYRNDAIDGKEAFKFSQLHWNRLNIRCREIVIWEVIVVRREAVVRIDLQKADPTWQLSPHHSQHL